MENFRYVTEKTFLNLEFNKRGRDVLSVKLSLDVLTSRLALVSGLGPLRLVETFCEGERRAYCSCSCSCSYSDTNQHDICGLDIFVYSFFTLSFTYLS